MTSCAALVRVGSVNGLARLAEAGGALDPALSAATGAGCTVIVAPLGAADVEIADLVTHTTRSWLTSTSQAPRKTPRLLVCRTATDPRSVLVDAIEDYLFVSPALGTALLLLHPAEGYLSPGVQILQARAEPRSSAAWTKLVAAVLGPGMTANAVETVPML